MCIRSTHPLELDYRGGRLSERWSELLAPGPAKGSYQTWPLLGQELDRCTKRHSPLRFSTLHSYVLGLRLSMSIVILVEYRPMATDRSQEQRIVRVIRVCMCMCVYDIPLPQTNTVSTDPSLLLLVPMKIPITTRWSVLIGK